MLCSKGIEFKIIIIALKTNHGIAQKYIFVLITFKKK